MWFNVASIFGSGQLFEPYMNAQYGCFLEPELAFEYNDTID